MELGKRLKLGTVVKDTATGLKGMLTHMLMEMNGSRYYNFQPKGLDTKTRQPLEAKWLVDSRIEGGVWTTDDKDWPIAVPGYRSRGHRQRLQGFGSIHDAAHQRLRSLRRPGKGLAGYRCPGANREL